MTTAAENHEILLNRARDIFEFERALQTAKGESTTEEFNDELGWGRLVFPDGSMLGIGLEDRVANVYTAEDAAEYHKWVAQ